MKLTAIILLTACLQVSARTAGQSITLSEKNTALSKVLSEIEKQSGYNFIYEKDLISKADRVSIDVKDATLDKVLELIFQNQPLDYKVSETYIVLSPKPIPALQSADLSFPSPPIDIKGHVTNENGDPAEGVNITVKGTRQITTTDANGEFILKDIDPNATIIITMAEYETQEIPIGGRSSIFIKLKRKATSIEEVTINKGYYSTTERLNTGNVAIVKGEDIAKQPVTDPLQALEGRVAGLDITQASGVPGAYSTVRIRGENSMLYGSNKPKSAGDPLYVVDGIPFSSETLTSPFIGGGIVGGITQKYQPIQTFNNYVGQGLSPFQSLNPADIESIQVLKDADATAIYGSRGANGVILITTKKGKPGKLKANVNVTSGASKTSRFFHLLNTPEYLQMHREALKNDGLTQFLSPQFATFFPYLLLWDTTRYTDWQKVLFGKASPFTTANMEIFGGNANTQFRLGAGYKYQGTTMPGDYEDQTPSVHFSLTNTSNDQRFQAQFSANFSNDNSDLPNDNLVSYLAIAPDAPPLYDASGNLNWATYQGTNTWTNPLSYTRIRSKAVTDYYAANLHLSYKLLKGLDIASNFGYSHSQMNQTILSPGTSQPPPLNTIPDFRGSSFSTSNNRSWIIEPQANYDAAIGKGKLSVLLGTSFQSNSQDSRALGANGFSSDALISNIQAASTVTVRGSSASLYHYNGTYARIGYSLEDKYVINLTGRRDGSTRFGPGKQFGNFGAVGAAWIFSKEKWVGNHNPVLSFGKLRGSYGVTGNDHIGDYQYLSYYVPQGIFYQGSAGLSPTQLANPDFRWEQTKKLEIGTELGFFRDRVNLGASWYRNRTGNQLVFAPLATITGFTGVEENLPALIQNTGWEFELNTVNIKSQSFSWRTTANLGINRNKLLSFPGIENTSYAHTYTVGKSLDQQPSHNHFLGVDPQTGLYQFAAKDGSGIPGSVADDSYSNKSTAPVFSGGVGNTITYKGLQLDFFFRFAKQTGVNYLYSFGSPGSGSNEPVEVFNNWRKPGDVSAIQRFSRGGGGDAYTNFGASDGIYTDASFIRLSSVSLSYDLPDNINKKVHMGSSRVFINCQNLFIITGYRGLDPEAQGLNLPLPRTITAGLQFSL